MSVERRIKHKRHLTYVSRDAGYAAEKKIYTETMLAAITSALDVFSEDHKAFFILYFGLSEHGRWTATSIAQHYAVERDSILAAIAAIMQSLPSDEHRRFVRRYFEFV